MSLSRNQIISQLKEIDLTGKSVLDVGSGKKTKQARDYTKGEPKKYVTLDINKEVEPDIVADLNKDVWLPDLCIQINFLTTFKFDIVFCLETLEHCWRPINAIRVLYDALKPNGTCYISVPFINPIHDEHDMLRFTDEWFERVLPIVGFRSIEVKRRVATKGLDDLMSFYKKESMKFSKVRIKRDESYKLADIGYWVVAKK